MPYAVKEIFFTRQGEGFHAGREAVFCRFSGCNLWSGLEKDRPTATCRFCDTDFVGMDIHESGGRYATAAELANKISSFWPADNLDRFVVCTGGEPLLQMDGLLIEALHDRNFFIAVETNGTKLPPPGIDWICVSPKAEAPLQLKEGNELKLVIPQEGISPRDFEHMDFEHFFVQPMDGPDLARNTALAEIQVVRNPLWKVSRQMHKAWGIR